MLKLVACANSTAYVVSDLEAASAFYINKLGFAVVRSYEEPPFFAQIARDAGGLNFSLVNCRGLVVLEATA